MRIDDLYSGKLNNVTVNNDGAASFFREGMVVDGLITALDDDKATILFGDKKELVASFDGTAGQRMSDTDGRRMTLPRELMKNPEVGQLRSFEVVSVTPQKVVLKDLTLENADGIAQKMSFLKVDPSLPQMIEDFSEVMGDEEKEDNDSIKNMSDEDYSRLKYEGMTLERFASERLVRALARIKEGRVFKAELVDEAVDSIRTRDAEIERMAVGSHFNTAGEKRIAELLYRADLPITDENIDAVKAAAGMADAAGRLNDNSMAYMIGRELEATPSNIYKAVYSGVSKFTPIAEEDWRQLEKSAEAVVNSVNSRNFTDRATLSDARWLLEHDLPLTEDNMIFRQELKALAGRALQSGENAADEFRASNLNAAVNALRQGRQPADAILTGEAFVKEQAEQESIIGTIRKVHTISDNAIRLVFRGSAAGVEQPEAQKNAPVSIEQLAGAEQKLAENPKIAEGLSAGMTGQEITAKLQLEEIRLKLTVEAGQKMLAKGISVATDGIEQVVAGLRELQREYFRNLSQEVSAGGTSVTEAEAIEGAEAVSLAEETDLYTSGLRKAPAAVLADTLGERHEITFRGLAERAINLRARLLGEGTGFEDIEGNVQAPSARNASQEALRAYENGATEIRKDLGDSIKKAFSNMDSLLETNGIELTEANRRAVRILGYNSMEITAENVESIKYYDAKVTRLTERLTPPVVMELLKRGINPLDATVDRLSYELDGILEELGPTPEEKYSSFLVKMEESGQITPEQRSGYIGIYRLLYQLEKSDGAAIGAAVRSGKQLTLGNLMTEVRSGKTSIDADIDDETEIRETSYSNSITDQILNGLGTGRRHSFDPQTDMEDEAITYETRLVKELTGHDRPMAWSRALEGEDAEAMTIEGLADRIIKEEKEEMNATAGELNRGMDNSEHIDSERADLIRNVMSSNHGTREFLKAFGLKDSFVNIKAAASELGIPMEGADDGTEPGTAKNIDWTLVTKQQLASALESELDTDELLGIRTRIANARARQAFETSINAANSVSLTEQLDRLGLIRNLAASRHYRFTVEDGESPASINLTIINNTGNAGTLSIQLKTADYNLTADMSLVMMRASYLGGSTGSGNSDDGLMTGTYSSVSLESGTEERENEYQMGITGRIYCDSSSALHELDGKLRRFQTSLYGIGLKADDIRLAQGSESETRYMKRLTQAKLGEGGAKAQPKINTNLLYRAARSFVATFM